MQQLPSVLWRCWLDGRKGIRPVKTYGEDDGGGHWLVRMEWRPVRWSVCVPLLIFPCTIKSQKFSSGTGSPGWSWKKGRKTVVVWCVVYSRETEIDLVSQLDASLWLLLTLAPVFFSRCCVLQLESWCWFALRLRDRHLTSVFVVTVQCLESCWPGRVSLCRFIDQDPTFGFGSAGSI